MKPTRKRKPTPAPRWHVRAVVTYSDGAINAAIADLGSRNLSDLEDHETRWLADRSKALREVRRDRKATGTWTITKPEKTR